MSLTAENIVGEAENEANPLHEWFEWEDDKASHNWRLYQARQLVNVIIEEPVGDDEPTTHSFEIIKTNDHREYKHVYDIFDKKEWKEQVIKQALLYLKSWRSKYTIYSEFKEVDKAIQKVEKRFEVEKKQDETNTRRTKRSTASVSS